MSLISSLGLALVMLQSPVARAPLAEQAADSSQLRALSELDAAEARYRAAIALHPGVAAYSFSLGLVLERKGRKPEALRAYGEAVRLDSSSARNRAGYGRLLLELGDPAAAAVQLREAQRLSPLDTQVARLLAQAEQQSDASANNYHDYSDFESTPSSWTAHGSRLLFGFLLSIAALPLLAPILGALYLLIVQAPLELARETRRSARLSSGSIL